MEHAIQLQTEATRALAALKEDPLCMYIYMHIVDIIEENRILS